MAQLIWTGTDEQEQFHDDRRNVTYWPSERPVEVDEAVAERYLEHDGWIEAEDPEGVDVAEVLEEHDRSRASLQAEVDDESDATQPTDVSDTPGNEGSEVELQGEPDGESEAEAESESERNTGSGPTDEVETETDGNGGDTDDATSDDVGYGEGGFHAASEPERTETTTDGADGSGREATAESEGSDDGFDAHQFLDRNWQAVASSIREGAADGHLDAVESAELNREGSPRENSVLRAIEDRRGAHSSGDGSESDASGD